MPYTQAANQTTGTSMTRSFVTGPHIAQVGFTLFIQLKMTLKSGSFILNPPLPKCQDCRPLRQTCPIFKMDSYKFDDRHSRPAYYSD